MGVGFVHSSDPSNIHADLQDWLDKAKEAVVGQKVTDISAEGNDIIVQLENGRALVFINPRGKGLGRLVAELAEDDLPTKDQASSN